MPLRRYKKKRFGNDSQLVIARANDICGDYESQGFDLTLRQLYYVFVSKGWIANKDTEYKRLGGIINDARLAGLMDWNHITDRTRNVRQEPHWANPAGVVDAAARGYNTAKWDDQDERLEVWIEKDALVGVLDSVCPNNDVDYFSCRGYTSQSEVWQAAQRLRKYIVNGQRVTILHLGDHDPSGIDMTRDIAERLWRFIAYDLMYVNDYSSDKAIATANEMFTVERIALNMDQIEQYDPPPNPAKITDSRSTAYIEEYGDESWELDALDPATLVALIQGHIEDHRDDDLWQDAVAREESEREILTATSNRWGDVSSFLNMTGAIMAIRAR